MLSSTDIDRPWATSLCGGALQYFDAWANGSCGAETRHGTLYNHDNLHDWLSGSGSYCIPSDDHGESSPTAASIHLLFCPLSTKGHFHYGIDESVCKSIETGLNLHPITYNTIMNNGGEFTKFFEVSQPGSKHPKRIKLVLKVANNYNISYSCVSLSYDQTTGTTNILLHGAREEEWLGIMEFIHRERKLWSHPLLIPLALMHHQTSMAGNYEASIDRSLFDAERAIGYVIPGLLSPSAPFGRGPEADLKDITRRLHSVRTELASLGFSTQYVLNCSDFLIKTMRDMHDKVLSTSEKLLSDQEEILQEQLEHLKSKTQCLQSHARSLQERAKSQVGLTFSLIAQEENSISRALAENSTTISISSKRDSSTMKTIALITILFLPSTFVATFFNITMINWNPGSDTGPVVSPYIWTYWVISILLTVLVIVIWRIWLSWENKRFMKDETHSKQCCKHDGRTDNSIATGLQLVHKFLSAPAYSKTRGQDCERGVGV